jgi:hypothetical protein
MGFSRGLVYLEMREFILSFIPNAIIHTHLPYNQYIRHMNECDITLPPLPFVNRVSGNCHDTSDLDLVLRNPEAPDQGQKNLAAFRQALSESNIPILVDLMDWALIPQSFRDEISQQHCPLPLADHATTISTNTGIDIAPETLYDRSVSCFGQ